MENKTIQSSQSTEDTAHRKNSKSIKPTLLFLTMLLLFGVCAYGIYTWQKSESQRQVSALRTQIKDLESSAKSESENKSVEQVTYKSRIGGLTLTLPSPYVVIVNVDGNRGGAPGTTLRIGKEESAGVIRDNVYQWVEIEIAHLSSNIDQQAQAVKNTLTESGFENIIVTDTTLKSTTAKLITAKGFSYDLARRIYILKSGEFMYRFTSSTQDISKNSEMFTAVLDGAVIEEKSLN